MLTPLSPASERLRKALRANDPNAVRKALSEGADPNVPARDYGPPALLTAIERGWVDCVRALAEANADFLSLPPGAATRRPLALAAAGFSQAALQSVVEASPRLQSANALLVALNGVAGEAADSSTVPWLLTRLAQQPTTPNLIKQVDALARRQIGADNLTALSATARAFPFIMATEEARARLLLKAVSDRSRRCVTWLLKHGADPDRKVPGGTTPRRAAIYGDHAALYAEMGKAKPSPTTQNKSEWTQRVLATFQGNGRGSTQILPMIWKEGPWSEQRKIELIAQSFSPRKGRPFAGVLDTLAVDTMDPPDLRKALRFVVQHRLLPENASLAGRRVEDLLRRVLIDPEIAPESEGVLDGLAKNGFNLHAPLFMPTLGEPAPSALELAQGTPALRAWAERVVATRLSQSLARTLPTAADRPRPRM